jgi:NAD(P)-dependent dehydrogenase (short-subunit alcohol dehydrogenase family)
VDVGDLFSIQRAALAISQEVEEVHLWLYAVGDILAKPVSQMDPAEWKRILDANLTGAYLATQASWHLLAKDAHLFYLGALHERLRLPGLSAYAAAKAGVEALAEVVRKESRRKVCVVRPAAVDTPLWKKAPFKLPPSHLTSANLAVRIFQAYRDGTQGVIDL